MSANQKRKKALARRDSTTRKANTLANLKLAKAKLATMMRKVSILEEELTKQNRIDEFGEVFTPSELVNEILDEVPIEMWKDPDEKWLDPTCGDGVFLTEIKQRLLKYHSERHILLHMIYGVDITEKNVYDCIVKLFRVDNKNRIAIINTPQAVSTIAKKFSFKGRAGIKALFLLDGELIRNLVCADGLEYQYNFGDEEDTDKKGQYRLDF